MNKPLCRNNQPKPQITSIFGLDLRKCWRLFGYSHTIDLDLVENHFYQHRIVYN